MTLTQWAIKHGVSAVALDELRGQVFGHTLPDVEPVPRGKSEAYAQSAIRLAAPVYKASLFRNNVGALKDASGRLLRYGLANDSASLNKVIKSGDLIGWRTITATEGQRVAQFVSIECKEPGWQYSGNEHEKAQQRWIEMITAAGGQAFFSTGNLPFEIPADS